MAYNFEFVTTTLPTPASGPSEITLAENVEADIKAIAEAENDFPAGSMMPLDMTDYVEDSDFAEYRGADGNVAWETVPKKERQKFSQSHYQKIRQWLGTDSELHLFQSWGSLTASGVPVGCWIARLTPEQFEERTRLHRAGKRFYFRSA